MSTYRPGTVVRYTPTRERHDPRWCREGTAIANEQGVLVDTYWCSGGDSHVLRRDDELASVEVLFHIDDYDELDRYGRGTPAVWETYHPDDRRRVTSQHGLQARYFVRKGATPDLETQIANAREAVREAEAEVEGAERRLERRRDELAALTEPRRRVLRERIKA